MKRRGEGREMNEEEGRGCARERGKLAHYMMMLSDFILALAARFSVSSGKHPFGHCNTPFQLIRLWIQAEGPASRSPQSSFPSHEERCRAAVLGLPLSVRKLLTHAYFSKVWRAIGQVPPA